MTNSFKVGDKVRCLVDYYKSYQKGEVTTVMRLDVSSIGNKVIILNNPLTEYQSSMYSVDNWELVERVSRTQENKPMAYERTKYFGVKLSEGQDPRFVNIEGQTETVMRDTKSQALKDVQNVIQEGERYVVLQLVALIEPAPARPPVVVTEYK